MNTLPALADAGEIQDNNTLPHSEALRDALEAAAGFALAEKADATRKAYASDMARFRRWADSHGTDALPASVPTVAAYLADLARARRKISTIDRAAAAIAYAHRLRGLTPPTEAEPVKAVLRGIRRRTGGAVERKAPATGRALQGMLKRIPDTLRGQRDRALLLLGFAAALRRSELVALTVEDLERVPEGLIVHVRRSKTDQTGEGHAIAVPRGRRLCAVTAVDAWLAAAGIADGPVFRRIRKGGHLTLDALTDQSVALIVKRWAKAARLDPDQFAGHSLRAGMVTSALEAGADLLKVMAVTRHTNVQTLAGYDRRAQAFKNHALKGVL